MPDLKEIRFVHNFSGIVQELEVSLCIDGKHYERRDIDEVISDIKHRIQLSYSIDLTGTHEENYAGTLIGDEVVNFLDTMKFNYDNVCGLSHYFRYIGEIPINLAKINYLGITKDSMLAVLKMLQMEGRHCNLKSAIEDIEVRIGTIEMCIEKKLFMLLCVSYEIGLFELTAVLAEILYLGGYSS